MKKYLTLFTMILISVALAALFQHGDNFNSSASLVNKESIVDQNILTMNNEAKQVNYLYSSGKLVGAINDISVIDERLHEVYMELYADIYLDTKVTIGEDMYITSELSLYDYEDIDQQIADYLIDNKLYGIEVDAIELVNEDGVYDTLYVKDIDDFYAARDRYMLNFISQESFDMIKSGQDVPQLSTYGTREVDIQIKEQMNIVKAVADPDNIMMDKAEILKYLSYGSNTSERIYEVQEFDTIEKVAWATGLLPEQVVSINSDILKNVEQVITPGTFLNVMYFSSPITVLVTQEIIAREVVYADETIFNTDDTLREGESYVVTSGFEGSKNVQYSDVYQDGKVINHEVISEVVTMQPQQEVVNVGTMVIPGVGTGTFRWPIDNPKLTQRFNPSNNHFAIDIVNKYERYGNIYAADRGTIIKNTYHPINGHYIWIDHGNGYMSHYGHMKKPGNYPVGTKVNKGDIIGTIGATGNVTGVHIHFYVEKNGKRVDPCNGLLPC